MKRFFFLLLLGVTLQLNAQQKKAAILVTQFGTSFDEGRKASLDVLFNVIKAAYPEYEVREAFSSPRIRKALEKKGIHKDSAEEALLRLKLDGYENVKLASEYLFVPLTFFVMSLEGPVAIIMPITIKVIKRIFSS